jgi:hypothetical protein
MATLTDTSPKYILLATDGQPTCLNNGGSAADDTAAIQAVADVATKGFKTFVVGVATTANATADATLSQMAMNGGLPRAATPSYYPVASSADLVAALGLIQNIVMGMCTYPLGAPAANADPTKVTVTVDGAPSIKGDPNGWDYNPTMTAVTFVGTTCDQLMTGTLRNVQVLYGCKIDVPQ